MSSHKSRPEIYVMLSRGMTPKQIIAAGQPYHSVYVYNKRWKEAVESVNKKTVVA